MANSSTKIELSSVEYWEISYITTKILSESTNPYQAAVWVLSGHEPGIRCAAVSPDSEGEGDFARVTKHTIFGLGEGLPGRAWCPRRWCGNRM